MGQGVKGPTLIFCKFTFNLGLARLLECPCRARDRETSLPQTSSVAEDVANSDKGTVFVINFSPALREIINETKYLEQLGFPVSELARNVALQEDKFLR